MNFLPSFSIWQFAAAGAICAAGPIIIHLLNRRRFKVVHWAAMDFLREALQRNRRIMQMRDLLLLLLRTLAVLLIGFALAQPFLARNDESYDGTRPLHAVLVFDNSMSMGYQAGTSTSELDTTLNAAKDVARNFIEKLPEDSRVSIIPLCGSRFGSSPDAYTKKDAVAAIDRVHVVDRSASVQRAINEAKTACETGPKLAKRVVFIGDQQVANWQDLSGDKPFADLPSVQIVDVASADWENSWVSEFRIQDGVADVETPTTFLVQLRHQGAGSREDVQVTLAVDGVEVSSKTVSLDPGLGAREIAFEYLFNTYRPDPGNPISVPVSVHITPDRLPADDERYLVVPVVAALQVVFVDQYGPDDEDPVEGRLGETRHLRRLLAPVTSRENATRQLVEIRHLRWDQLTQENLEDARLVVMAGLAEPGSAANVELLRDYVKQGGPLVIAAGGNVDPARNSGFDPARWTASAWLGGDGILPAPLMARPVGVTPGEAAGQLKPFFLSYESLASHYYFQLAGVGEDELRDLYGEPIFFKAVQADLDEGTLTALREAEKQRLRGVLELLDSAAAQSEDLAALDSEAAIRDDAESRLRTDEDAISRLRPSWLLWNNESTDLFADVPPEEDEQARRGWLDRMSARTLPRVLARFDNSEKTPFLIERRIGKGTVMLVTTSLLSDWNTLPKTNAILIFDRILRDLVQGTLPQRNFPATERITLPIQGNDREVAIELSRPDASGDIEILDTGFIDREQLGFTISQPLTRGLYRVTARPNEDIGTATTRPLWELPLTVNGSSDESELTPLTEAEFDERLAADNVQWVGVGEEISLAGNQIRGQDSWWWLVTVVLFLLVFELFLLGRTARHQPAPSVGERIAA